LITIQHLANQRLRVLLLSYGRKSIQFINGDSLDLKKDAFLKWDFLYFFCKSITILDIMQFYAYATAGIHLDKEKEKFESLRQAFETIRVNDVTVIDHTMRGIIQVVFETLGKFKEQLFY
jgi:hypothetical protein